MKRLITFVSILLAHAACAQHVSKEISPTVARSFVDQLIHVSGEYVFAKKAAEFQDYLQTHMSTYETIRDSNALADKLTADMRAMAHDKHLAVIYRDRGPASESGEESAEKASAHSFELAGGFGIRTVARLPGNIGILDLAYLSDDPQGFAAADGAMALLQGSDALIIDLRRNMGGSPDMVSHLLGYLFPKQVQLTSFVWRTGNSERIEEHWTPPYVPGAHMATTPVYVLLSTRTFSAGEQLAYDLQALHRATLIGETSGGGANPSTAAYPLGSQFEAFIPNGRALNPTTKTNWEGVGVAPDIKVEASTALLEAYKRALQGSNSAATDLRQQRSRERATADPEQALRDAGFLAKQTPDPIGMR